LSEPDLVNPFNPDDSQMLSSEEVFSPQELADQESNKQLRLANEAKAPGLLDSDSLAELRKLAEGNFYFFAKAVLQLTKLNKRIHYPICRLLENLEKDKRLRVLLPRGWYKTSLMLAYCLWRAVRDPEIRILYCMNTITNAVSKLSSIDKHIKGNELLRRLWPEILPTNKEAWTAERMQLKRTSAWPEATFEAAGIRTAVVSRHYNLIIEDDTVAPDLDEIGEDNMVPTKEDIDKAIGWHRLATPLLTDQKSDQIAVIGTRWFEKDLLSWIKENEGKFYKHHERASVENEHGEADEGGKPTFPEEFPIEILEQIRASMGPYMFSCLYLNKPIRSSDMLFQLDWFDYYEMLPSQVVYTTTVDPGGAPEDTKGETDWTVVLTCAKDLKTGKAYVVDYARGKMNPGELLNVLFAHIRQYKPIRVGVESVAYQKSLLYWIRERQTSEQTYTTILPITHTGKSKGIRIMGLQPLIMSKALLFKRHHKDMVNELLSFPYGKHDDLADALCMQLAVLPRILPNQMEEVDEPETLGERTFEWAVDALRNQNRGSRGVVTGLVRSIAESPMRRLVDTSARHSFFNKRKVG